MGRECVSGCPCEPLNPRNLSACRVRYSGHVYFDTFPRNEDPVREAEYNIRSFKAMWARAEALGRAGVEQLLLKHDAMGVLELMEVV